MTTTEGPSQERTYVETVGAPTEHVVVAQPPEVLVPAQAAVVRTSSATRFAPDALIAGAVGLVLLVVGLIAMIRGGFDGPMSTPVVSVLGFTHTTTLGLIEAGAGLFLLLCAAVQSRGGAMFGGLALAVAGFIGIVQRSSFEHSLALESNWAAIVMIAGAVVALAALMLPRFARSSTIVEQR